MEKIMVFAIVFGSIIWILVKIFNMFMDPCQAKVKMSGFKQS